jgi:3-oxoacyl-[acyl-carrier protein] reductase
MTDADREVDTSMRLTGRTALVTGVSRRRGIGFAVAARLADLGASVVVHHHTAHDVEQYGAADDLDDLLDELRQHLRPGARMAEVPGDLGTEGGPRTVSFATRPTVGTPSRSAPRPPRPSTPIGRSMRAPRCY